VNVRWLFLGALAVVAIIAIIACGDPSHIFQGRAYIDGRDCLGTVSSVDVVTGDDPGFTCKPTCLAQPTDAGRQLYVSTMCAPYPFTFDASGTDPECPAVLAAETRDDTCNVDGSSANPAPKDAAAD
jgi:hypothetical protein